LDEQQRSLMLSIFEHELADAAVVSIGRGPAHDSFYHRTVNLVRLPDRQRLRVRGRLGSSTEVPGSAPAAPGVGGIAARIGGRGA
jgi:hypothetical protein